MDSDGYMDWPEDMKEDLVKVSNPDELDITMNGYQGFVKGMKVYPEKYAIVYPALGIAGEAGEIAEKVKKWLRGDKELNKELLMKEIGDVMWYCASMADDLGYTLEEVVIANIEKLEKRKQENKLKGDGDTR